MAHPGHGGCTVQELCYRVYGGKRTLYFLLIPASDPDTTILFPVENADQNGIRNIITAEEAEDVMKTLFETEATWDSDHKKRKQTYEAVAKGSDLFAIAAMIKDLLVQETRAVLGSFEKDILLKVKKRLFSEIALAKGLDFDDTVRLACRTVV